MEQNIFGRVQEVQKLLLQLRAPCSAGVRLQTTAPSPAPTSSPTVNGGFMTPCGTHGARSVASGTVTIITDATGMVGDFLVVGGDAGSGQDYGAGGSGAGGTRHSYGNNPGQTAVTAAPGNTPGVTSSSWSHSCYKCYAR